MKLPGRALNYESLKHASKDFYLNWVLLTWPKVKGLALENNLKVQEICQICQHPVFWKPVCIGQTFTLNSPKTPVCIGQTFTLTSPKTEQEPDAEHHFTSFWGTADLEVNLFALKEETDGLFWTYTVVQGTPSVCGAVAKSRNAFFQAPQSHKVVLQRLPLKQEPTHNKPEV